MNEQQEIKEISLTDLALYCLEKWRLILVIMLVAGILAGIYKYQSVERNNQSAKQEASLEASSEDGGDTETEPVSIKERSLKSYQQIIERCKKDVEVQEDYLNHSIVMEIDPFHVSTGTLSYYIDGGKQLDNLVAAYRTYITDGSLAEELYEKNPDVSVADLRYLISFSNSERETYRLEDNQVMRPEKLVIQIQIRMPDDELCEEYLAEAKKVVEAYSVQLQKALAEHKLSLLSSVQSEMTDSGIQSYQASLRSTYAEAVRNLQTFQTEREAVLALEEEGTDDTSGSSSAVLENSFAAALKYAVIGIVIGVLFVCFVLMIVYIMSGRIHDTKTFAREFGMPMLGLIRDSGEKKRAFGFIDAWIFRLEEGAYARLGFEDQVKIAAANAQAEINKISGREGLKKIMIAGTVAEKEVAALCAQLTAKIPEVSWTSYMQIVFQADAIKELEDCDGVLFVEKKGMSDARFIAKERKMAADRGVPAVGSVVVC